MKVSSTPLSGLKKTLSRLVAMTYCPDFPPPPSLTDVVKAVLLGTSATPRLLGQAGWLSPRPAVTRTAFRRSGTLGPARWGGRLAISHLISAGHLRLFSLHVSALMYICMYVCIYVWMYVCMYICMDVCMYVYMYACVHLCMYVCMYVCMYLCLYTGMYACMYVFMCFGVFVCLCVYEGYWKGR
ncbi:unnamed protein product [Protopolystoma xenopodis]|uniref:Uncharacterized protein n=1 Tax=Protopolystoma xenopodis TaxID=117903 RepID=A0A3S5ACY3_9PLAT|nr:unnamed protein product [Protopolystoma xenopodis]